MTTIDEFEEFMKDIGGGHILQKEAGSYVHAPSFVAFDVWQFRQQEIDALKTEIERLKSGGETPVAWIDGNPPFPQNQEWFIAETTFGDRVVLRSLPDEYEYDYKTADETYIKADKIVRWMQFPDCEFARPTSKVITDNEIRSVFLAHGFSIKDGQDDLKPYVYAAARALLSRYNDHAPSNHIADTSKMVNAGNQDALDAARYRYLRDVSCEEEGDGALVVIFRGDWTISIEQAELCGEVLDATIDAQMQHTTEPEE